MPHLLFEILPDCLSKWNNYPNKQIIPLLPELILETQFLIGKVDGIEVTTSASWKH